LHFDIKRHRNTHVPQLKGWGPALSNFCDPLASTHTVRCKRPNSGR